MKSFFTFFLIIIVSRIPIEFTIPCLIYLKRDLHLSQQMYELNFTIYYLGAIISQIFFGLISDKIGRKSILSVGITCIIIGTIYCALSNNYISLYIARFFCGMGGGIIPSMKRAILKDSHEGNKLTKALSMSSNNLIFTMTIGPLLGTMLELWFGWRISLLVLSFFMIFCLLFIINHFQETLNVHNKQKSNNSNIIKIYLSILRKKNFIIYSLCSGLSFSIMQLYMQSSNFIIIEYFKFSFISYCVFFCILPLSYVFGSIILHYLCDHQSNLYVIYAGCILMLIGSLLGIIVMHKNLGGIFYFISIMIVFTGCRVVIPNFISLSFVDTTNNGATSSMYGIIQMIVVFSLSFFFQLIEKGYVPTNLCMTFVITTIIVIFLMTDFRFIAKRGCKP